jgi:predicted deacetylase
MSSLVNISIDDVSPHPMSSVKVLNRCFELIDNFPNIKFSLFVPTSYWRTVKPQIATKSPLQIDMFPDFCETLLNLPKSNFEICYHGFYHGIPGKSDNDEFQHLDYDQAIERFNLMFEVVKLAGLEETFKKIFRPPAWRMSAEAINAAIKSGIEILALSPDDYAKKTYGSVVNKLSNIVYYNCNPPFKPLNLFPSTEIVYHACEWDKNYLNNDLTNELLSFLNLNRKNIKFCFLKDII